MDIGKKRPRTSRPTSTRKKMKIDDTNEEIRVLYIDTFDFFNLGHMHQLEKCKNIFVNASLIVGIIADQDTTDVCIMNDYERANTVKQCKWVSDII